MPKQVVKTVNAQQLQVGDVILRDSENEPELTVTDRPIVKVKYVYVGYSAKGIVGQIPFEKTDSVTVRREEPTEEEVAARTREQANKWAAESLERANNRVTEAKIKLSDALAIRDVNWHGRYWASFAEAQMELGLWEYVVRVAEAREIDLHDALLLVRDEIKKRLLDLGHFLPRSTDMLSNYCSALESEVRLRFIRDIEWRT